MSAGALLSLLVVAAAAIFVLAPLFRHGAAVEERRDAATSEEEDLASQREMALASLKDLEDDRATGKIGDRDYAEVKARLTTRAVEILKRQDEILAARSGGGPSPVPEPPGPPTR